jgi:hypothetical protein
MIPPMVTVERATELALSLPDTTSAPHFDRTAFRVPRRIFATLGARARDLNLRLDPELQTAVVEGRPRAFAPIAGGWGRQGWTRCDLDAVAEIDLTRALREAHALATTPPPPRRRATAAKRAAPATKRKRSTR